MVLEKDNKIGELHGRVPCLDFFRQTYDMQKTNLPILFPRCEGWKMEPLGFFIWSLACFGFDSCICNSCLCFVFLEQYISFLSEPVLRIIKKPNEVSVDMWPD